MRRNYINKVTIVGLGNIGMGYDLEEYSNEKILSHAKAFFYNKNFHLVGGVDIKEDLRKKLKNKYNCKTFISISKAIAETKPNIVVIATPTPFHLANIKEVFNNGNPEIIFCEKPLSLNYQDSQKILEICESNKSKLFVNYFRRVIPSINKISSAIKSKEIKLPFKGTCTYSKGLFNSASHFINLFQFYFGKVIDIKIINKNNSDLDFEPDFELKFSDGEIIFISNKNKSIFINEFDLIMKNGKLTFKNGGSDIFWEPIIKDERFPGYKILGIKSKLSNNEFDKIQLYSCNEINSIIKNESSNLCSGKAALTTQQVLEKIKIKICNL